MLETFKIKRTVELECTPTPEELAEVFCSMDADEQAIFFEKIHDVAKTWDRDFVLQLEAIVSSSFHTKKGKSIMSDMGDYSEDIKD